MKDSLMMEGMFMKKMNAEELMMLAFEGGEEYWRQDAEGRLPGSDARRDALDKADQLRAYRIGRWGRMEDKAWEDYKVRNNMCGEPNPEGSSKVGTCTKPKGHDWHVRPEERVHRDDRIRMSWVKHAPIIRIPNSKEEQ